MILAGDIGATNSRLGLFTVRDGKPVRQQSWRVSSHAHASIHPLLDELGLERGAVKAVCLGVAGAILDGTAELTNLGWVIETARLAEQFPSARVALLNDVEATGYGVEWLEPSSLLTLNVGEPAPQATAALIAAGSGLGESILYRHDGRMTPLPTEAGHSDLGPNSILECEFVHFMRRRFGHVSLDRTLSGPGLQLMYEFLRDSGGGPEQPEIARAIAAGEGSAAISEAALAASCRLSRQALDLWVGFYGAEAGNLALRSLARGGVYVAGGIAPKIRSKLVDGAFMKAFVAKGRMEPFLHTVPVHVVLEDETALLGAAGYAAQNLL